MQLGIIYTKHRDTVFSIPAFCSLGARFETRQDVLLCLLFSLFSSVLQPKLWQYL